MDAVVGIARARRGARRADAALTPRAPLPPRARTHAFVQDRIAEGILEAYSCIYDAIKDPSNGYADPGYSLKHNPDHLRTVLGIR